MISAQLEAAIMEKRRGGAAEHLEHTPTQKREPHMYLFTGVG
jgi:hypothetical protein